MSNLTQFDHYLADDGPAALVIREYLMPVEGADAVFFPSTYAAGEGFAGGYNIDGDPNGKNFCLIDSVGSQANRIEPMFKEPSISSLVPQIIVKAGEKEINLLDAGHRAGDAIVRCSALQQELHDAFKAVLKGNPEPLARIAPTSLVFGVWDSRETQAKLPRLIASTIRAFDIREIKRSAQFNPALDYLEAGLLDEPEDLRDPDGEVKGKHPFAKRGFAHVPATRTHGGVVATGGIRRDVTLALAALRLLSVETDKAKTLALQRYILGLALVAFTRLPLGYLRQGSILVLDPDKPREFVEVAFNGKRQPAGVTHDTAISYAREAADAFGVGANRTESFDTKRAKEDLKPKKDKIPKKDKSLK